MDRIKYVGFDMDHTLVGKDSTVSGCDTLFRAKCHKNVVVFHIM